MNVCYRSKERKMNCCKRCSMRKNSHTTESPMFSFLFLLHRDKKYPIIWEKRFSVS